MLYADGKVVTPLWKAKPGDTRASTHPPSDPDYQRLYPRRADGESINPVQRERVHRDGVADEIQELAVASGGVGSSEPAAVVEDHLVDRPRPRESCRRRAGIKR
jgi:hypothetical protein